MFRFLCDKRGAVNPLFIRIIMGVVCALVLILLGISTILDKQSDDEYEKWAKSENQKIYNDSQQIRITERQLLKLRREVNDSFYQRLEHDLPVRILIVGDAYGNGFGVSNKSLVWSKLLQAGLKKKFGVRVEVENITLSGMNGGYGAWVQLMKLPDGTASPVLTAAGAVKDKEGTYTGEVQNDTGDVKKQNGEFAGEILDARTVAASRENEYDLCIVSLGMTDEPQMFELYYEGVLRQIRRKFEKCSIISLLSNQALTAPELGYADENYDALYKISKHYDASVINVGLEMTDPDAAANGATISQLPYGSATSESLAADMRSDGIPQQKADEIASKDLAERTAAAEEAILKYTIHGLYLNNAGQKFLSERILDFIEKKVSKSTGYNDKEISPLKKEVTTLDRYHYFPVSELVRLNDFTYVLAENTVKAAAGVEDRDGVFPFSDKAGADGERVSDPAGEGAENKAAGVNVLKPGELGTIIGVDYDLVKGDNDLYAATEDGTNGFGRIVQRNNDAVKVRFIMPLNDGYSYERDRNLILAFSTKEQADTLHGIILGGDFTLPSYLDGFQHVPYIGLTDEDGKPIPLDRDGKPSETENDLPEQTTKENDKTSNAGEPGRPSEANPGNPAAIPETTIQSTEAETTAATFGNDQPAQGNATAVSESLSNLSAASTQGEEASETSGSTYSESENTETYDYEETYTDTYSESENSETSDYEDTHADTYPGSEATDASDSGDITTGIGPERPDETEWSAYEVGNPQR
ncbi:hypothetical protein [Oribacterium sp. NK2B42]|uniref:hypothetical protein n=1 Tax=Oribacterium sp. NK2B42 TaxID=689781 RepID=UPI000418B372|nr:hypothetical protein [Oribacterium sp. NK2B42]